MRGEFVERVVLVDHHTVRKRNLARVLDLDHQILEHVEQPARHRRWRLGMIGMIHGHALRSFMAAATLAGTSASIAPPRRDTSLTSEDDRYPYSGLVATNSVTIPDR